MKTFTGTYGKIDEAIDNLTNAQCTAQEEGGLPFDLATKLQKAIELCEEIIGELDRDLHDDLTRAIERYK